MNKTLIALALLGTLSTQAVANEEERNWKATAGLGFSLTSGNTDTTSLSTNIFIDQTLESWDMNYKFDAIKQKSEDETSADNRHYLVKGQYKLTDKDTFLFSELKRDEDKFGPYAHINTLSMGYGQKLYSSESVKIKANIGPGYTQYERNETEEDGTSSIVHIGGNLHWVISESADFNQSLIIDKQLSDDNNTLTILQSTVTAKLNGAFKMALDLKITNNSKVPGDKKHTDTVTSVNLVYSF